MCLLQDQDGSDVELTKPVRVSSLPEGQRRGAWRRSRASLCILDILAHPPNLKGPIEGDDSVSGEL